jgi:hypothetical protein
MKKEIIIKDMIVLILHGDNFVTLSRYPDSNGFGKATFSFPLTAQLADRIERSKIVQVEKVSSDGSLVYRRLDFYTMERIIEVFTDILEFKNQ